jgi:hypothetical protein
MKLTSRLLLLSLIVVGLTQCKKDDDDNGPGNADPGEIVFTMGSESFTVTSASGIVLTFGSVQTLTITGGFAKKSSVENESGFSLSVYDEGGIQEKEYPFHLDEQETSWGSVTLARMVDNQYTSYSSMTGEGFINITNLSSNSVSGTFSGTFSVFSSETDGTETIEVSGGAFNSIPLLSFSE